MYWRNGRYVRRASLLPLVLAALSIFLALWAQRQIPQPNPADPLILFSLAGLLLLLAHHRYSLPSYHSERHSERSEESSALIPNCHSKRSEESSNPPPRDDILRHARDATEQALHGRKLRPRLGLALLAAALASNLLALVLFRDPAAPGLRRGSTRPRSAC